MMGVVVVIEETDLKLMDGRYVGFGQYNKDKEKQQEERTELMKNQTALMTKMNAVLWVGSVIAVALIGVLVELAVGL